MPRAYPPGTWLRFRYCGLDRLGRKRRTTMRGRVIEVQEYHPRRPYHILVEATDGHRYLTRRANVVRHGPTLRSVR